MTPDYLRRLSISASHPRTIFDAVTNADQRQVVEKHVMVRLEDLRDAVAALQLPHGPENN